MKSFTKKSLSILALSITGAVACGSFVGCGGDDDDTTGPTPDAGGKLDSSTGGDSGGKTDSGGGTDSGSTDGGAGGDASDASDAGDAAPGGPTISRTGSVYFLQEATAVGNSNLYIKAAGASFVQTVGASSLYTCTAPATFGSCTYTDCTKNAPVDAGTADSGTDSGVDAGPKTWDTGVITLTGGTGFPTGGVVLTPSSSTDLYSVTSPATFDTTTQFIKSGDNITFTSAGNQSSVGSFTSTIAAATDVTFSSPTFTGVTTKSTSFSRTVDLPVTWGTNAATGSSIVATLLATTVATGELQSISCTFPGSSTTSVIPTAALSKFPNVDGTAVTGSASFTPETTATVSAGNDGAAATAADAWKITTTVEAASTAGSFTTTN